MLRRLVLAATLVGAVTFVALPASADAWCKTRNRCTWLSKKYTANAYVSCIGLWVPLCYHHGNGCGSASATCGWRSCLWGGASASASNGPGGCSTTKQRNGLGIAGHYIATAARNDDFGDSSADSRVEFDDSTRSVILHLDRLSLSSLANGLRERLDVYAFVEDTGDGGVSDEPVRTDANTVWHGSVTLKDGVVSSDLGDARTLIVDTYDGGLSRASADGVSVRIPLDLTPEAFENLVIEVNLSEENHDTPPSR